MFNEKNLNEKRYKSAFIGGIYTVYRNKIFKNGDREFIDRLLAIDEILSIDIDYNETQIFNEYFIKLKEGSNLDLLENKISEIYKDISNKYADEEWDIYDHVYIGNAPDIPRNTVYWIFKKTQEGDDKIDTIQIV